MPDDTFDPSYKRIARGLALFWFILALIAVLIIRTPPAYVGFAVVTLLCLLMALTGPNTSPRIFGFGILGIAAVLAVAAEFAGPDWPMDSAALGTLAITAGAFGVGQIFSSRRHGAPEPWLENWAGWIALAGLLACGITALLVTPNYVTTPMGLVAIEAVAAFAELAGKTWRTPLAGAACLAGIAILARHLEPTLPAVATSWLRRSWMLAPQFWTFLIPPAAWLLYCLKARPGWQPTMAGLAFVVLAEWIGVEVTRLFKN
jgi:hypothetical protein